MIRRLIRETLFIIARRDLAHFLEEHEDQILRVFREEIDKLDEQIPEENFFIDIKMVPLGEIILKAALNAIRRFLRNEVDNSTQN